LREGRHGVGQEAAIIHVPSDTLFAALVAAWVEAGGRGESWGEVFPQAGKNADPPLLLTSAFPYAGGVRFYPLPQVDLDPLGVEVQERRKDLKRIAFVSEGIFRRIVSGQSLAGYLPPPSGEPGKGLFLQGRTLWLTVDEVAQLPEAMRTVEKQERRSERPLRALQHLPVWQADKVPRVTVNRINSAGNIFHTGRVTFSPDCGLWFGVEWRRPETPLDGGVSYREAFEQALSLLTDSGLGSERAVGYGAFRWQSGGSLSWPDPAPDALYVTLSRYHPRPSETPGAFSGDFVAYSLVPVAGYLQTPTGAAQRRRRLWLAAEGSVLRALGPGPYGDLTDVRPHVGAFPHPVWRYGLACPVALKEVAHA
ncbi:MAG: type III-A CRISPR-associated RAMP protein Csm4, partial [Anaerolineae bacterium]|nr:type III-A CRISPR-associated RAMP protein Csm4 [Anaerolineae bacterium]